MEKKVSFSHKNSGKSATDLVPFRTTGTGSSPVPVENSLVMKNQILKETFIENMKQQITP